MSTIITVANHKGGTGKSFTVQNLGAVLAKYHQQNTLMIDLDPQGSLTQSCGIGDVADRSMAEVIGTDRMGTMPIKNIIRQLGPRLYLAPSDIALSDSEMGLIARLNREHVLDRVITPIRDKYDVILVDTPPSKSLLLYNALTASDLVLVPSQPVGVDMRGLRLFLDTLDQIREETNPGLEALILPTFYDNRLTAHRDTIEAMTAAGWPVLEVRIKRSIRASEAASIGKAVGEYAPGNPVDESYIQLGEAIQKWLTEKNTRKPSKT